MYVKLEGSYQEVAEKIGLGELALKVNNSCSQDILAEIKRDLPRTKYVSFTLSFSEFIKSWTGQEVSLCFAQGNINAHLFPSLLMQAFVGFDWETSQLRDVISISKDQHTEILKDITNPSNDNNLAFAYYNDLKEPCGICISYIKSYPHLWISTVMIKTVADPNQRLVKMFGSPEILNAFNQFKKRPYARFTAITTPEIEFLATIDSPGIEALLSNVLDDYNRVDDTKIQILNTKITTGQNIGDWDNTIQELDCIFESCLKKENISEAEQFKIKSALYADIYHYGYFKDSETPTEELLNDIKKHCLILVPKLLETQKKSLEIMKEVPEPISLESTFIQRNYGSLFLATIGIIATIAIFLSLTGVLSPLGIILGSAATVLLIAFGTIAAGLAAGSITKIIVGEKDLVHYQEITKGLEKHYKNLIRQDSKQYIGRILPIVKSTSESKSASIKEDTPDDEADVTCLNFCQ